MPLKDFLGEKRQLLGLKLGMLLFPCFWDKKSPSWSHCRDWEEKYPTCHLQEAFRPTEEKTAAIKLSDLIVATVTLKKFCKAIFVTPKAWNTIKIKLFFSQALNNCLIFVFKSSSIRFCYSGWFCFYLSVRYLILLKSGLWIKNNLYTDF